MSQIGKMIRWERFVDKKTKKGLIVPIDHGFTRGPIAGLESSSKVASWITHSAINGIIAHKGMIERLGIQGYLSNKAVMLHLNGMIATADNNYKKVQLTDVKSALALGADAISLELNFDGLVDDANIALLGQITDEAHQFGMPVLTMLVDKKQNNNNQEKISRMRHFIRSSMELGADAVKITYDMPIKHLPDLLENLTEDIPIFLAGGALSSDQEIIQCAKAAMRSGVAGMCIGRNIFQRSQPHEFLNQLHAVIQG